MVLWIAMIAGVAAAREDRHIAIDVLSRFLAPKPKAFVSLFVDLFTAAVCAALAWYSVGMVGFAIEDEEVVNALIFIRSAFQKPIQIVDVVNATCLSRRELERRFKKYLKKTIKSEIEG